MGRSTLAIFALTLALPLLGCGHRRHHVAAGCPAGTGWDGASCVPLGEPPPAQAEAQPPGEEQASQGEGASGPAIDACPGGSVPRGDRCLCPDGLAWIDEQCRQAAQAQAEAPPPPPRRGHAFRPPPPPSIPNVNVNVNVGVPPLRHESPGAPPPSSPPPRAQPQAPPPNVTYAACTGGMVRNGTACQCPQGTGWEGGRCQITCHPTQRREGNACVCPKDTRWNGASCEIWQECRGGQVHLGASCICPAQTRWNGQQCAPTGGAPTRR